MTSEAVRLQRPVAVGTKFEPDGRVRRFAGNTVICHVPADGVLFAALVAMQASYAAAPFARKLTLLPASSLHMTVFEGVCEDIREPSRWPRDLPTDLPLDAVTRHFAERLGCFDPACRLPFRLRPAPPTPSWGGAVLALAPLDEAEDANLRGLRDRLAERLLLRVPTHAGYVFHITLAYVIDWLDPEEDAAIRVLYAAGARRIADLGPVELGPPEFCRFDDMFAFERLSLLGR